MEWIYHFVSQRPLVPTSGRRSRPRPATCCCTPTVWAAAPCRSRSTDRERCRAVLTASSPAPDPPQHPEPPPPRRDPHCSLTVCCWNILHSPRAPEGEGSVERGTVTAVGSGPTCSVGGGVSSPAFIRNVSDSSNSSAAARRKLTVWVHLSAELRSNMCEVWKQPSDQRVLLSVNPTFNGTHLTAVDQRFLSASDFQPGSLRCFLQLGGCSD